MNVVWVEWVFKDVMFICVIGESKLVSFDLFVEIIVMVVI